MYMCFGCTAEWFTILKGYVSFIFIRRYWLQSLRYTAHPRSSFVLCTVACTSSSSLPVLSASRFPLVTASSLSMPVDRFPFCYSHQFAACFRSTYKQYHWLDGRESEWTPGVGDGQGGLACCDSWGRKQLDTTERLNWLDKQYHTVFILLCVTHFS